MCGNNQVPSNHLIVTSCVLPTQRVFYTESVSVDNITGSLVILDFDTGMLYKSNKDSY